MDNKTSNFVETVEDRIKEQKKNNILTVGFGNIKTGRLAGVDLQYTGEGPKSISEEKFNNLIGSISLPDDITEEEFKKKAENYFSNFKDMNLKKRTGEEEKDWDSVVDSISLPDDITKEEFVRKLKSSMSPFISSVIPSKGKYIECATFKVPGRSNLSDINIETIISNLSKVIEDIYAAPYQLRVGYETYTDYLVIISIAHTLYKLEGYSLETRIALCRAKLLEFESYEVFCSLKTLASNIDKIELSGKTLKHIGEDFKDFVELVSKELKFIESELIENIS